MTDHLPTLLALKTRAEKALREPGDTLFVVGPLVWIAIVDGILKETDVEDRRVYLEGWYRHDGSARCPVPPDIIISAIQWKEGGTHSFKPTPGIDILTNRGRWQDVDCYRIAPSRKELIMADEPEPRWTAADILALKKPEDQIENTIRNGHIDDVVRKLKEGDNNG